MVVKSQHPYDIECYMQETLEHAFVHWQQGKYQL